MHKTSWFDFFNLKHELKHADASMCLFVCMGVQ